MKLEDAHCAIEPFVGCPFGDLVDAGLLPDLHTNKGHVGQVLEGLLGLRLNSRHLDFEDGELKTNKVQLSGKPIETVAIMQLSSQIDDVLARKPFRHLDLCRKVENLLYVPVYREGPERHWMFLPPIHIDMRTPKYAFMIELLEKDYLIISRELRAQVESGPDGQIHTASGHYMQVRAKDSLPYHPIFSSTYRRRVSNKNHAFYFKKAFAVYLQSLSPDYPFDLQRYRREHAADA